MKQIIKQKKRKSSVSDDLDEIPQALGFKSLDKMMNESLELGTEEALVIAKIALTIGH